MGSCNCCCKELCGKSNNTKVSNKSKIQKSDINENIKSIEPMLKASADESQTDEENTNEEHILEMLLCDDTIIELCPISLKIINILSLYHLFIHNYSTEDLSNNICEIISDKMNDYDLINLRDNYHHMLAYHDSNDIFMKQLFEQLMILNNINGINGINDLENINYKLEIDENTNYHFGHLNDDEISMIQCLNQIHHDCTHKYINKNSNKNSNNNIDYNSDCMDENDTKASVHIDIKYSKNEKELRKIGKLKLKQMKKRQKKLDKTKVKTQTILNDDSWLNKEYKNKRSKHVISDSIQMLGNTKLVSNNLWKKSLDSLQENSSNNSFDLTSFDVSILAGDSEDAEFISYQDKKKKDIDGGYDIKYDIDRV